MSIAAYLWFIGVGVIAGLAILLYMTPSCIAARRGNRNTHAIVAFNVFLGWTFLGWVAALVWAVWKD